MPDKNDQPKAATPMPPVGGTSEYSRPRPSAGPVPPTPITPEPAAEQTARRAPVQGETQTSRLDAPTTRLGSNAQDTAPRPTTIPAASQQAAGNRSAAGAGAPPIPPVMPGPAPAQGPDAPGANGASAQDKRKGGNRALKTVGLSLVGGAIGAAAIVAALMGTGVIPSRVSPSGTSGQSITVNPSGEDTTLANAVSAKALPSVVSISVTTSNASGVGSGVILDTNGNILTNYHVIEDAQTISVSINGKSYDGTVVGSDESSDLAVVKVDLGGDQVTPIEVGDSSALKVGDWVMSIGSPFGLDQSVSTGIVSSLYRSTMMQGSTGSTIYTNLIQTDAAINPGNSGGALVNDEGKLVGINSIIESASGSSSGVGFAIPGNYATQIAKDLIDGKTPTHAYLGATFQTVTAQNARRNNLSVNQGAYVAEVSENSPAAQAGIQKGDIITKVGDEEVTSADGVVLAVRSHNVGDKVDVTLMRGSQQQTVSVTLGSDEELQKQQSQQQGQNGLDNGIDQNQGQNGNGMQGSPLEDLLNNLGGGYGYDNGYGDSLG